MTRAKVRIITNDVPRLRRFYQEVIGLSPIGDDRYMKFPAPGLTLAIASQQRMNKIAAGAIVPESNRSAIFDFEVEDVDQERACLQGIMAEFVLEPTTQPWGNRSTMFRDPDGNLVTSSRGYPLPREHKKDTSEAVARAVGRFLLALSASTIAPAPSNQALSMADAPSAIDPHPPRRIGVRDTEISYVDTGQGGPIVFLHGNPTYSYLWRNVIPHVSGLGRCLAPDMVGMS